MQKLLRKMLLLALMIVPMVTMAQGFSFTCDFENDADTAAWTYANGTATNKWVCGSAVHNGTGTNALYISSDATGATHQYTVGSASYAMVYQTLALTAGSYEYSYDWLCNGEGSSWGALYDYMRVVLVPGDVAITANDDNGLSYNSSPTGWIELDGGEALCQSTVWNTKSGIVNIPTDGDYKLLFYWRNDGGGGYQPPAAIDNISFILPTCPAPANLQIVSAVGDEVTISWTEMGSASSWIVEYEPASDETGALTVSETAYDTTITLSGLDYNTLYNVRVKADCGSEQSGTLRGTFRSACEAITLPYFYSFADVANNGFPSCWYSIDNPNSEDDNAKVATKDGATTLKFAYGAYVATPYIPLSGNLISLSFALQREGSSSGTMQVGFVTSLADIDNMSVVTTITPSDNLKHEYELDFSVLGEDVVEEGYIVFKQVQTRSAFWFYWLSNVSIRQHSDCQRPESIYATNVTYNSATLRWTPVLDASSYDVVYGTVNDPNDPTNITVTGIADDTVAIIDLASSTSYYMWVRNDCGGEYSDWRAGASFTTQVACAALENVAITSTTNYGAAIGWTVNPAIGAPATEVEVSYRVDGSTDPYTTVTTSNNYYLFSGLVPGTLYEYQLRTICDVDTAAAVTGNFSTVPCGVNIGNGTDLAKHFPTNIYERYSYAQMLYKAEELVGLDSIRGFAFNYSDGGGFVRTLDVYVGLVQRGSISTYDYVELDSLTKVASNTSFTVNNGWCVINLDTTIAYDGVSNLAIVVNDRTGSWASSRKVYCHAGGTSIYNAGYSSITVTDPGTLSSYAGVPNIVFITPCAALECAAPLLTVGEVTANEVNLVWAAGGLDNNWVVEYKLTADSVWTEFETTTNTSTTIMDLIPGSFYDVRVGSLCGEDTLYSNVSIFTECAAIPLPYTDNFTTSELNPCITIGNASSTSGYPSVSSSALYFGYTEEGYAIFPEIIEDLTTARMSFDMKAYNEANKVIIAIGTNKDDWSSFVPFDTISLTNSNTYEPKMVYFNNYTGTGHFIAIMSINTSIYIDNVVIEAAPECAMPVDLNISQVTSDAAVLSWNGNNGSSDGWLVQWRNTTSNESFEETVTETTYAFADLAADTPYEVMVKNLCGEDTIAAISPIYFRTECGLMVIPYIESFEGKPTYEFPTCWTNVAGSNEVVAYTNATTDGTHSLELDDDAVVVSPLVPLAGNTIAVDFLLKRASVDGGKIVVGFTTSANNVTAMEIVDTIAPSDNQIQHYELTFENITSVEQGYIVWKQIDRYNGWSSYNTEYNLDNIYIRQISNCARPEAVTVSNISYDKAFVSWTPIEGATDYEVLYGTINDVNSTSNISVPVSEDTVTLFNLAGNTTYYVWVRNNCGDSYSDWRAATEFTTQVSCARLANVEVTHTTQHGISLMWEYENNIGAPATNVEVSWKNSNDVDYTTIVTDHPYYIINDLLSATSYEIRLRTICSNDTAADYTMYVSTSACGHVIDGNNSTETNYNIPSHCNWKYTYAQMLYPASELAGVDTINAISFQWASDDVVTTRTWDIYMGHTTSNTLNASSPIAVSSLTQVGNAVNINLTKGWCTVTLTTPFVYQPGSNLVIAVDDNTGSYPSGGSKKFYVHAGSSIHCHSDSKNPDPAALTGTPSIYAVSDVPNIMFPEPCEENVCEAPLLAISALTTNSASLVWGHGNEGATWHVEYKLTAATEWTVANASVADTFVTIDNLQPGSFYDFRVGTICAEDTLYTTVLGFTDCAAVSVPFTENFNGGILNPCWTYGNLQAGNDDPSLSSKSIYMSYDPNSYFVLPEITDNISSLHALFSIKSYTENSSVIVAVGTDVNDFNSFVIIDTFTVAATETETVLPQECSFENYVGEGHYIAFFSPTGKMYIDDITVETLPACSYPSRLAISNITADGATITWSGDNRLTTGWIIDYNIVGDPMNVQSQTVAATDYSYTMTGLVPNTSYEVMVRNICSVDTVAALIPVTFRTECGVMALPYFETFENEEVNTYHSCWFTSGFHNLDYSTTVPYIDELSGNYRNILVFSDDVNMISPRVPIEGNRILVNFDAKAESTTRTGKLVVGFSTSVDDSTMMVIDTITFNNTDWNNYEYSFSSLTTTDTGYVVFKNIDNNPSTDYYGDEIYYGGYIDNVTIAVDNGCSRVSEITISGVTDNSAVISFNDSTNSGNYTIGYATVNNVNTMSDSVNVTTTSYTLTNLQPNTRYYVWVRNNCSVGGSPWTAAPVFKTPCVAMTELPYVENFDSYTVDVASGATAPTSYPMHTLPSCWNFINMSASRSDYPQVFITEKSDYADSLNCLFFKSGRNTTLYATLPQFTTHVSDLTLGFKYRNESLSVTTNGHLQVGVMTDINDTSSFILISDMPLINTLTSYSHSFVYDSLDANTDYVIAFRYVGISDNMYLSIDNVVVEQAPACPSPENFRMVNATSNSVTLTWSGVAASYNVQYRPDTSNTWINAPAATSTTTTINGLTPQTNYFARIQAVCGTTTGEWLNEIAFSTRCDAFAIPFTENFDSYNQDIASYGSAPTTYPNHFMPECWTFPNLTNSLPKIFLSENPSYVVTGNCLFFSSSSSIDGYAVLPAMNVPIDSLQISFDYRNEGTSISNSNLVIGVMTNPNDISTFRALEELPLSSSIVTAEHSFTADTGFVDGTTYYIAIRYGHNGYMMYAAIDNISIDYAPTCPRLATPSIDSVGANVAVVSWMGNASNYEFGYKAADDTVWNTQLVATNSVTLNNLTPVTTYEVRVRALCSATDTSEWSFIASFTTECATYELPFSEDFSTMGNNISNLDCWERYEGLLSDVMAGTETLEPVSSGWNCYNSSNYPVNNGGLNVFVDIYSSSVMDWLVTPNINIPAGAELTFDMAGRDWTSEGSEVYGSDDKFVVLASADNGATWVELQTWQDSAYQNIPKYDVGFDSINISLNQFANQVIKIAFYGESTVSGGDHYVHIDNVEVKSATPSCSTPTELAANDITYSSATLSWNGSASAYDVDYREQGATEWISATISETTLALTELTPLTAYEWRVRGNCGETIGTSEWQTSTFTTLELPCPMPTNVTATADGIDVTVDWTAEEGQSSWEVMVYDLDTILQTVSAHPATIEGLNSATTYNVQVRAICAENVQSEWTEAIQVTTASCGTVTNVAASEITDNSAKITWTAAGSEAKWEINYGEAGFAQGQGEFVESTATTFTLTGLESEMPYDVYVRAVCGDDFYGLWSNKISFETLPTDTPEGIDGVDGQFQFAIYPNPTHSATTISLNGVEGQVTISVVDMNGRTITSESIECGSDCEKRIDVAGLAQGTYFVRVLGNNINSVRKLIVR